MFDVLILGGMLIDGSGRPGYSADVGITEETVEATGDLSTASAHRTIDATSLTVSPGFIDTHVHSEGMLLLDPQHANGLRQGVTTEILGPDGLSYAPLSPDNYRMYRSYLSGILGLPPEDLDMSSVASFRSHYHRKVAINTAYTVPHGAIRLETVGFRDVPLIGQALEKAKRLVREGIERGAAGLSTGLSYYPQSYSDTAELIELCQAVREAAGVYVTHNRDVYRERAFGGGGVSEALEIARRSGVRVHFSHTRTTPENAGQVAQIMKAIDEAKTQGIDCTLELYPYPTGSSYAAMFLPSYAHESGPEAILARLSNEDECEKLARWIDTEFVEVLENAVFTNVPSEMNHHLEGMSWADVARERGVSLGTMICEILREEELNVGFRGAPPDSVARWRQVSRDCLELLARPDYMVGSDSILVGDLPHPRAYGTFPRLLGRLQSQFGILSLEQMVQRMTDNPAQRFGLKKRGQIKRGYFADIVVFDADHIIDTATYDDPCQYPVGIPFVLVNGRVAVDHERCTGVMAGQAVP